VGIYTDIPPVATPLVVRLVSDLSETRSQTSRRPGLRLFCRKLVTDLSATRSPTFLFVENLPLDLSLCRDRSILSETRFPTFFLLKTCRRPVFKQVFSKIDVMEFGHNTVHAITSLHSLPS